MTLDDLEELARDCVNRGAFECGETEVALARALLAVLPVVRAAEEWRDKKYPHEKTWQGNTVVIMDSPIVREVDQMRREMGGGK